MKDVSSIRTKDYRKHLFISSYLGHLKLNAHKNYIEMQKHRTFKKGKPQGIKNKRVTDNYVWEQMFYMSFI